MLSKEVWEVNKKYLILSIIIPLILAAILARLMTPNPEQSFTQKMRKFEKLDNACWNLEAYGKKYQQCKIGNEYFAKSKNNGENLKINTSGEELRFGTDSVAVYTTVAESKSANSLYWLDKLNIKDVKKTSIVRDKDAEGDTYNAELNNGTRIRVTFYKGLISQIEYSDILVSKGLVELDEEFSRDDVIVNIKMLEPSKDIANEMKLDSNVRLLTLDEFQSYMTRSDKNLTKDILELKYAYLGKKMPKNSYEDEEEQYFDDEDNETELTELEIDEDNDSMSGHFQFMSDDEFDF